MTLDRPTPHPDEPLPLPEGYRRSIESVDRPVFRSALWLLVNMPIHISRLTAPEGTPEREYYRHYTTLCSRNTKGWMVGVHYWVGHDLQDAGPIQLHRYCPECLAAFQEENNRDHHA